jgi:hypothetical protein
VDRGDSKKRLELCSGAFSSDTRVAALLLDQETNSLGWKPMLIGLSRSAAWPSSPLDRRDARFRVCIVVIVPSSRQFRNQ